MRYSTPFLVAVALTLTACGDGASQSPEAPSMEVASREVRSESQFLRNANPIHGQYIVVLKQDAVARDIQEVARELAGRYRGQLNRTFRHALRGFVMSMPEAEARALSLEPGVAYVEEDGWAYPDTIQPNATWGIDRVDQQFGGRVSLDYTAVNDGNGASDCNGHGTHVAGTLGGATWG